MQAPGGRYYDLGSGTGKTLIAACAVHEFEYVCGVEFLEGLYNTSQEVVSKWETTHKKALQPVEGREPSSTLIELFHGDLLDTTIADWVSGDVVLCNCACFSSDLVEQLIEETEAMRVGSFFVTVTKEFLSER